MLDNYFKNFKNADKIGFVLLLTLFPFLLYYYSPILPIKEELTCNSEFCKIEQYHMFSSHTTKIINLPLILSIRQAKDLYTPSFRRINFKEICYTNKLETDPKPVFDFPYLSYLRAKKDLSILETANIKNTKSIRIVKHSIMIYILIAFGIMAIIMAIFCPLFIKVE